MDTHDQAQSPAPIPDIDAIHLGALAAEKIIEPDYLIHPFSNNPTNEPQFGDSHPRELPTSEQSTAEKGSQNQRVEYLEDALQRAKQDQEKADNETQSWKNISTVLAEHTGNQELLEQQQRYQATHDQLTGILNRRGLFDLWQPEEDDIPGLIDLDGFKTVNDTAGHSAGDAILKDVAKILEKIFPENAILARLGGDEFVVVTRHTTRAQAQSLFEAALVEIRNMNNDHELSASIGLAQGSASTGGDVLLEQADKAMYEMKHSGKNGMVWATTES